MQKRFLVLLLIVAVVGLSQNLPELKKHQPGDFDNIFVEKIADDANQTSFIIWIKNEVALHKHADHTENIYILEGKGEMILGEEKHIINKGDYFNIPKNTPHGLKVLSSSPIKVLSIQSPKFDGTDRILINE